MNLEPLYVLFVHRPDAYALQRDDGEYTACREYITDRLIEDHLAGNITVAAYTLGKDSTVKWICFDFDDAANPAEAWNKAREFYLNLRVQDIGPVLLEPSGNKGAHVWVFCEPTRAANARAWAAQISKGIECEIFPKQDALEGDGLGNCVKLPLALHRVSKQKSFLISEDGTKRLSIDEALAYLEKLASMPRYKIPEAHGYPSTPCSSPATRKVPKSIAEILEDSNASEQERVSLVMQLHAQHPEWSEEPVHFLNFIEERQKWTDWNRVKTAEKIAVVLAKYGEKPNPVRGTTESNETPDDLLDKLCERHLADGGKIVYKPTVELCVNYLLENHHVHTFQDTGIIYLYEDGVYLDDGENKLRKKLQSDFWAVRRVEELEYSKISNNFFNEVIGHIKRLTFLPREFETPLNQICLENGVLDLETLELRPHDPELVFLTKLPVKYDPAATCPKFEKFVGEIVEAEHVETIFEMIGFCIYRKYFLTKAFVLHGSGRNGKSKLLEMVRRFLGAKNVSTWSLHDLLSNRFAKADLFARHANIFADLPAKHLTDVSAFKMLTGEDQITGEKKFQPAFTFTSYAKMMFSANRLSETSEDSDAFFRRWFILDFPNNFDGAKADPFIVDKVATPEELSGILNRSVAALKRLIETGQFSAEPPLEQTRERYIRLSDSMGAFALDCCEFEPESIITKDSALALYRDYCKLNKYTPEQAQTFKKKLPEKLSFSIIEYRPKDKDGETNIRPVSWKGLSITLPSEPTKTKILYNGSNLADLNSMHARAREEKGNFGSSQGGLIENKSAKSDAPTLADFEDSDTGASQ